MNFKNVNAIVSGGGSGLGLATARLIIENGGKVIALDLDNKNIDESIVNHDNYFFVFNDVSNEEKTKKNIEYAFAKFGNISLIVNCAGIGLPSKVITKEGIHSDNLFKKIININLIGSFNVLKFAAEKMQNNKCDNDGFRGLIINTASIAAFDGQIGQAAYSASKGAIVAITLPVARELARYGIRVCTIAPGLFQTPMMDGLPEKAHQSLIDSTLYPKRLGKPIEYANLVKSIYENNMLNGETIRLDGALRLAPK